MRSRSGGRHGWQGVWEAGNVGRNPLEAGGIGGGAQEASTSTLSAEEGGDVREAIQAPAKWHSRPTA
jgi:hypothetical protein